MCVAPLKRFDINNTKCRKNGEKRRNIWKSKVSTSTTQNYKEMSTIRATAFQGTATRPRIVLNHSNTFACQREAYKQPDGITSTLTVPELISSSQIKDFSWDITQGWAWCTPHLHNWINAMQRKRRKKRKKNSRLFK